jgi:hypothetical protein
MSLEHAAQRTQCTHRRFRWADVAGARPPSLFFCRTRSRRRGPVRHGYDDRVIVGLPWLSAARMGAFMPLLPRNFMSSRARSIAYWGTTGLLGLGMAGGGMAQVLRAASPRRRSGRGCRRNKATSLGWPPGRPTQCLGYALGDGFPTSLCRTLGRFAGGARVRGCFSEPAFGR